MLSGFSELTPAFTRRDNSQAPPPEPCTAPTPQEILTSIVFSNQTQQRYHDLKTPQIMIDPKKHLQDPK
jgi:hypothetical protein